MSYAADSHIAVLDGTVLDLSRDLVDVTGVVWAWTGKRDRRGQPLMRSRLNASFMHHAKPVPLDEVYANHGPLIPQPAPVTAAERLAAYTASPDRWVSAGGAA